MQNIHDLLEGGAADAKVVYLLRYGVDGLSQMVNRSFWP